MPTLDEHRDLIQFIAMLILLVSAGIGVLDSRVLAEFRIAHGVLVAVAAWTLWRGIRKRRKDR